MNKLPVTLGSTVISKAGRDEGRIFLVVDSLDDEYVLISDGDTHKMEKPKKKKRKHLKVVIEADAEITERLQSSKMQNYEVREWLSHKEE